MRIAIGSDHAGFRMKEHLIAVLTDGGHAVVDLGTDSEESCDYPIFCSAVGREVAKAEIARRGDPAEEAAEGALIELDGHAAPARRVRRARQPAAASGLPPAGQGAAAAQPRRRPTGRRA